MIDKGGKANCKVKIHVPEDSYKKAGIFEFAVRQLLVSDGAEEKELGRLMRHFGQPAELGHSHFQGHCSKHCSKHCPEDCKEECC